MIKAKVNGVEVTIYGYELVKGVQCALCKVPEVNQKIYYPVNQIEVSYECNDL